MEAQVFFPPELTSHSGLLCGKFRQALLLPWLQNCSCSPHWLHQPVQGVTAGVRGEPHLPLSVGDPLGPRLFSFSLTVALKVGLLTQSSSS